MSKVLRVAILGGGRMAQKHAVAVRLQPEARLIAVVDPRLSPEEIQSAFGKDISGYRDTRQLLAESKPDVVHVVTPPDTHAALAIQCLEAGAHVYVEKPFTPTAEEAARVLALAKAKNLHVCAGHQVLFQRAGTAYRQHLSMIGPVVHVESYFSFKPVRRRPDGGAPLSSVAQLVDILPHPIYLLLSAMEGSGAEPELCGLDVDPSGEVRALVRSGTALATLVVTLRGRPIESYLRVVGTNGSVEADLILGDVIKSLGPGASGPAVVIKPFSQSVQKFFGSLAGVARLLLRRQKSYPGLGELLTLFYGSLRGEGAPPISPEAILQTVRLCEQIAARLYVADEAEERAAANELDALTHGLPSIDRRRGIVLVTGGSGFLGRRVLRALRQHGWSVRAVVRKTPSARTRLPGIEYVEADLGQPIPAGIMSEVSVVAHLAAETMGNRSAHERNTVVATGNLITAMEAANVRKLINISSIAVLRPGRYELNESSAVDRGNESRGPYVWAKAEAEMLAAERSASGRLDLRTVRLGPLVDFGNFTAPGRLGREVARLFVAMGTPGNRLAVCDVDTAATVIAHFVQNFESGPVCLNLIEAPPTTRRELVRRLRVTRPDLKVMWLPFPVLRLLSAAAMALQKLLRPGRPALDLYAAFKSERYAANLASEVIAAARRDMPHVETRGLAQSLTV